MLFWWSKMALKMYSWGVLKHRDSGAEVASTAMLPVEFD